MKKTYKKLTADEIAEMADRGEDISQFFTNKGRIKYSLQRDNVDFTVEMLVELDKAASKLNINR